MSTRLGINLGSLVACLVLAGVIALVHATEGFPNNQWISVKNDQQEVAKTEIEEAMKEARKAERKTKKTGQQEADAALSSGEGVVVTQVNGDKGKPRKSKEGAKLEGKSGKGKKSGRGSKTSTASPVPKKAKKARKEGHEKEVPQNVQSSQFMSLQNAIQIPGMSQQSVDDKPTTVTQMAASALSAATQANGVSGVSGASGVGGVPGIPGIPTAASDLSSPGGLTEPLERELLAQSQQVNKLPAAVTSDVSAGAEAAMAFTTQGVTGEGGPAAMTVAAVQQAASNLDPTHLTENGSLKSTKDVGVESVRAVMGEEASQVVEDSIDKMAAVAQGQNQKESNSR